MSKDYGMGTGVWGLVIRILRLQASMLKFGIYGPAKVDRIWGIWGPCYNIPKAILYLLKGDYRDSGVAWV